MAAFAAPRGTCLGKCDPGGHSSHPHATVKSNDRATPFVAVISTALASSWASAPSRRCRLRNREGSA
jgi:hypothetical protein